MVTKLRKIIVFMYYKCQMSYTLFHYEVTFKRFVICFCTPCLISKPHECGAASDCQTTDCPCNRVPGDWVPHWPSAPGDQVPSGHWVPHYQKLLLNVRKCWLAMPLGAGILHWVLACRTIEEKTDRLDLFQCNQQSGVLDCTDILTFRRIQRHPWRHNYLMTLS